MRDRRTQRDGADADRRRHPRRVADHLRQDAAERAAGRSAACRHRTPWTPFCRRPTPRDSRCRRSLDPRAAPISGDPDRLQQIVWNLLSNAVKFTPQQGRRAGAARTRQFARGDRGQRHGSGISPDFLPHIFERFRQADSGTTREHGGLGLGLAIVRHLVELHGGTIHAESGGRDTGSTFRVRLPLMIVHRQTARRTSRSSDDGCRAHRAANCPTLPVCARPRGGR